VFVLLLVSIAALTGADFSLSSAAPGPVEATTLTVISPVYNATRTLTGYREKTVWNETRTTTTRVSTVAVTSVRYSTLTVFIVKGGTTTHASYVWVYETTSTVQKPYIVTVTVAAANLVTETTQVTRVVPLYLDSETRVTHLASCSTACVSENGESTTLFLILSAIAGVSAIALLPWQGNRNVQSHSTLATTLTKHFISWLSNEIVVNIA
jgi:hypothetical protein